MTVENFLSKIGSCDIKAVELAVKLNVSRQAVHKMLSSDIKQVRIRTLEKYARATGAKFRFEKVFA